jgi:hypothetical protein
MEINGFAGLKTNSHGFSSLKSKHEELHPIFLVLAYQCNYCAKMDNTVHVAEMYS